MRRVPLLMLSLAILLSCFGAFPAYAQESAMSSQIVRQVRMELEEVLQLLKR